MPSFQGSSQPRDRLDPGIEPVSLVSPAWQADPYPCTTWEAQGLIGHQTNSEQAPPRHKANEDGGFGSKVQGS